ncbi:hypothetical protein FGO68_gene963 [Halteria grandinella]|uniref:Uncharacterized protein n=1 Tax=Halteria grandinella TaxID=5974 RepID=A0A8J8SU87_HALGN|nr:hypothetical protein FGO68_gene963 [Halteria grandinella]
MFADCLQFTTEQMGNNILIYIDLKQHSYYLLQNWIYDEFIVFIALINLLWSFLERLFLPHLGCVIEPGYLIEGELIFFASRPTFAINKFIAVDSPLNHQLVQDLGFCVVAQKYMYAYFLSLSMLTPNCARYLSCHFLRCSFFLYEISAYNDSRYSLMENFLLSFIGILNGTALTISSSGYENSITYLCLSAYSAVSLIFGLQQSNLLIRSRASSVAPVKNYAKDFFFETFIEARILPAS